MKKINWHNTVPNLLSVIFHPVWYPLAGIFFILYINPDNYLISQEYKALMLKITFLCTIVFPLAVLPLMFFLKAFKSIHLNTTRERFIPLALVSIAYYFEFFLVFRYAHYYLITIFLFSLCIGVLSLLIINIFWKISIHLTGLGGAVALILILSLKYQLDLSNILAVIILLSGIIASARLSLRAHTIHQIWAGFITGFTVVFVTFLMY